MSGSVGVRYEYQPVVEPSFTRRISREIDHRQSNAACFECALRELSGVSSHQLAARLDRLTDLELSNLASAIVKLA